METMVANHRWAVLVATIGGVQRQQQHTGPRQGAFIKTRAVPGRTRALRAAPRRAAQNRLWAHWLRDSGRLTMSQLLCNQTHNAHKSLSRFEVRSAYLINVGLETVVNPSFQRAAGVPFLQSQTSPSNSV